jgi:hypothetical protein
VVGRQLARIVRLSSLTAHSVQYLKIKLVTWSREKREGDRAADFLLPGDEHLHPAESGQAGHEPATACNHAHLGRSAGRMFQQHVDELVDNDAVAR